MVAIAVCGLVLSFFNTCLNCMIVGLIFYKYFALHM